MTSPPIFRLNSSSQSQLRPVCGTHLPLFYHPSEKKQSGRQQNGQQEGLGAGRWANHRLQGPESD